MNKVQRMAEKDASRWAYAEMFFGEGAGVQRKLLNAEISDKAHSIDGYAQKFDQAYARQDMSQHAIDAAKDRRRIDRGKAVKRNLSAAVSGKRNNFTNGVGIALLVWGAAHQSGLDVEIKRVAKAKYQKGKAWAHMKRAEWRAKREGSHKIHSL